MLIVRQDDDTNLWVAKIASAEDEPAYEINGIFLQTAPVRGLACALFVMEDKAKEVLLRLF